MTRARASRLVLALIVGAALASAGAPHEQPASATSPHRAAVVVDLGDGHVRVGCVSFTEDHISGLEALDRASMAPVAQTFGGQGSAVCALCGKGCTAGSTCLTCKAPNYWAYYHDGVYSSVGSGSTQVRDGDTEGWKWGKGERPTSVPFSTVCPPTPPSTRPVQTTTRPPATAPPPTPPLTPAPGTGSGGASRGQNGPAVTGNPGSTVLPGPGSSGVRPTSPSSTGATSSPSTSAPDRPRTGTKSGAQRTPTTTTQSTPSGNEQASSGGANHVVIQRTGSQAGAAATGSHGSGGTSVVSILAFVAVLAVVAGLIVVFRRRRAGIG